MCLSCADYHVLCSPVVLRTINKLLYTSAFQPKRRQKLVHSTGVRTHAMKSNKGVGVGVGGGEAWLDPLPPGFNPPTPVHYFPPYPAPPPFFFRLPPPKIKKFLPPPPPIWSPTPAHFSSKPGSLKPRSFHSLGVSRQPFWQVQGLLQMPCGGQHLQIVESFH